jgi:hypothetical protein
MTVPLHRVAGLLLALCASLSLAPLTANQHPGQTTAPIPPQNQTGGVLPPQGLYDSCLIQEEACASHLDVLAEHGFKLILNYGQLYGNSAAQIAYADRADALGMQIIWSINYRPDWTADNLLAKYPELAAECNCRDNLGFITYFINLVKDHPATWGYYLADEVSPDEHDRLLVYSDLIRRLDPDHPRLYIVAGSNDPMELYFNFPSFMQDTADIMGPCYYPYGYIDPGDSLSRYTGEAARLSQEWASQLGLQPAIVLQAFSQIRYAEVPLCMPWPDCAPFPSYEQMKAQRDQTLLNAQPAILLWWTYQDILQTDDPARHMDDLAAAAFSPLPVQAPAIVSPAAACPAGWSCADIGSPVLSGTQHLADGTWMIAGSGWDIWTRMWEKADQFRYVWKTFDPGFALSARVISQTDTHSSAKAGLMIRKSFDPVAPYYAVFVTPGRGVRVQYRADFIEKSHDLAYVLGSAPVFLKIENHGTTFQAYVSPDGETWKPIPNAAINLPALDGKLMAGMAVSAHDETTLSTVEFDQVSLREPREIAAGPLKPDVSRLVAALVAAAVLLSAGLLVYRRKLHTSPPEPQSIPASLPER